MKRNIVALAGRRIDAVDAEVRFPFENLDLVRHRILSFFRNNSTCFLISSAACGADLIALNIAAELGIDTKVVLPFDRTLFKRVSVVDRPGNWGTLYDEIIAELAMKHSVIELSYDEGDSNAFKDTNNKILSEAQKYATSNVKLIACIVWDGESKDADDLTADFAIEAKKRNFKIYEILTT